MRRPDTSPGVQVMVKKRGAVIVLRGGEETGHLTWSTGDGEEEKGGRRLERQ